MQVLLNDIECYCPLYLPHPLHPTPNPCDVAPPTYALLNVIAPPMTRPQPQAMYLASSRYADVIEHYCPPHLPLLARSLFSDSRVPGCLTRALLLSDSRVGVTSDSCCLARSPVV